MARSKSGSRKASPSRQKSLVQVNKKKAQADAAAAEKAKQKSKRGSKQGSRRGSEGSKKGKNKNQRDSNQGSRRGSNKNSQRNSQSSQGERKKRNRRKKKLNPKANEYTPQVSPRNGNGPRKDLKEVTRDPDEPVLFIGSIPHDATRADIVSTFTKLCPSGQIRACKMPTAFMKHLGMRHHRGFAFVVFHSHSDMASVLDISKADGVEIAGYEGKPLQVKAANDPKDMPTLEQKRKEQERRTGTDDQLFCGGIPWTCTEQDLREFFGKHGEIEQLFMPRWPTDPKTGLQKHKGYAFIRFTPKSFKKAKKLAGKGEKFMPNFPNIPIKINVAKGTEPAFPKSRGAQVARMQRMYNPYHHPAAHLYPSAMPMGVYKQVYGNQVPGPMPYMGYAGWNPSGM